MKKILSVVLVSVLLFSCSEKEIKRYHIDDIVCPNETFEEEEYKCFLKFNMNPVNGIVIDTNDYGDTTEYINFKNGILDGVYIIRNKKYTFTKNDNGIYILTNWKNGKKDGIEQVRYDYYGKENISYETHWKNGKKDGVEKQWYLDGQLKSQSKYDNDNLIFQKCWDENGNEIECEE